MIKSLAAVFPTSYEQIPDQQSRAFALDGDGDDNEDGDGNGAGGDRKKKRKDTRQRDLRKVPIGEERLEIPDPVWEGKAERIGAEESCELVWRRGGFVRLVIARIKYRTP